MPTNPAPGDLLVGPLRPDGLCMFVRVHEIRRGWVYFARGLRRPDVTEETEPPDASAELGRMALHDWHLEVALAESRNAD